jgi:uncharacterized membrane protein
VPSTPGAVLQAAAERARASLFLVPMAFVALGALLAVAGLAVDEELFGEAAIPVNVASTVDSARSVLSTVAAATMAFAGIAFSVALLVFQQSASQYSPRVIHGLFRDAFNKRVMGVVLGTFTFCLVVLRSVHGDVDGGPGEVVPTISVTVAVVLGIVSALAIVGFIDHNARRLDVSEILQRVSGSSRDRVRATWPERGSSGNGGSGSGPHPPPAGRPLDVPAGGDGWVQVVDVDRLLAVVPAGGTLRMTTAPGRYVVEETSIGVLRPRPDEPEDADHAVERVNAAVVVGASRTMTQDPAYGLRQLVDVGLKALSPGVNDPTTAQDVVFHVTAVLREMLAHDEPTRRVEGPDGRVVELPELPTHVELVRLGFSELRRAGASDPAVCAYLLEAIRLVDESLPTAGDGVAPVAAALRREAALVVAGVERSGALSEDVAAVRADHDERFGPAAPPEVLPGDRAG